MNGFKATNADEFLHRTFQIAVVGPKAATSTDSACSCVSFGGWMTNAPTMNAQHPASATVPQKREWKKPVLDILALEDAEHGMSHVHDGLNSHKSA